MHKNIARNIKIILLIAMSICLIFAAYLMWRTISSEEQSQGATLSAINDKGLYSDGYIAAYSVGAAKFLSEKKASVLTEKVAELLGEAQAESLRELLTVKSNELGNERVYYSIDAITTALIEKRKLSFLYFDYDGRGNRVYRKEGERYEVNPLGMVYSGENFYLVCFHDKYDNPASYRIDKMEDVQVEESKITIKKQFENFDLNAYKHETFGMYYGEKAQVTIFFPSELLDVVRDRFGAVELKNEGGWIYNRRNSSNKSYIFCVDSYV